MQSLVERSILRKKFESPLYNLISLWFHVHTPRYLPLMLYISCAHAYHFLRRQDHTVSIIKHCSHHPPF